MSVPVPITPPEKILIVMPRWVGDAVMATPLIEAMHEAWPDAAIDLLMKRFMRGLFKDSPWAGNVLELSGDTSFWSLRAELARSRYDMAVLLPNSLRPALLIWLGRAKQRIGYRRNGRSLLLTHGLPFPKQRPFRMVDFYGRLGQKLGLENTNRPMRLYVSDADCMAAADLLSRHDIDLGRSIVGINPGAKYGSSKLWPTYHFATVANTIAERQGAQIALLAGPGEDDLARDIAKEMTARSVALPSSEVDLAMLKAVLTHLDLLISNDTGPRHMAAALDVPAVTVYGPTHARWGETDFPLGTDCWIDIDCGPCMQRTCPLGHHRCMTDLEPDRVIEAAIMLLKESRMTADHDSRSSVPIVDISVDQQTIAGE